MTKNVRIVEWGMSIGLNGCTREHEISLADIIDEKEYDSLSEEEQEKVLSDYAQEEVWNYLDVWAIIKK